MSKFVMFVLNCTIVTVCPTAVFAAVITCYLLASVAISEWDRATVEARWEANAAYTKKEIMADYRIKMYYLQADGEVYPLMRVERIDKDGFIKDNQQIWEEIKKAHNKLHQNLTKEGQ